ncbi:hypothetical protein LWI28_004198 [Acer negundo]|uniref:Uncharacterized protein n=1 Tax=Acer negundo TaxID=4023 RepID=A0AAD5J2U4_ACENE|nr:hypothetical protein LWI28_004198 [Acer negundo]
MGCFEELLGSLQSHEDRMKRYEDKMKSHSHLAEIAIAIASKTIMHFTSSSSKATEITIHFQSLRSPKAVVRRRQVTAVVTRPVFIQSP